MHYYFPVVRCSGGNDHRQMSRAGEEQRSNKQRSSGGGIGFGGQRSSGGRFGSGGG